MILLHPTRLLALLACALLACQPLQAQTKPEIHIDRYGDPLPTGALLRFGTLRFTHCTSAAYSPDGKMIAIGGRNEVTLWDASTYKRIGRLKNSSDVNGTAVKFSSDCTRLAAIGSGGVPIDLWDLRTGEKKTYDPKSGTAHGGDWVDAITFSADGKYVHGGWYKSLLTIEASTGALRKSFDLDPRASLNRLVAFSRDAKLVAVQSRFGDEYRVQLRRVATGALVREFKAEQEFFDTLRFSPDGQTIALAGEIESGKVRYEAISLWNVSSGKLAHTIRVPSSAASFAFSEDGKLLASAQDVERVSFDARKPTSVCVWDLASTDKPIHRFDAFNVSNLWFSPNRKTIAWRCCNETLRFIDATTGKEINGYESHRGAIRSLRFSPDGKSLASASEDGSVRFWDASNGKQLVSIHGHASNVNDLAYSPDGKIVASAGDDRNVVVWDAKTGAKLRTLAEHGNVVRSVAFSNSGKTLAAGGYYRGFVWDPWTGTKLEEHDFRAGGLAFSPDEQMLFAAQPFGKEVVFFDRKTKADHYIATTNSTTSLALSQDGKMLAVGCNQRSLLLNAKSGKTLMTLPGHYNERGQVTFSPDGRYLASVGDGWNQTNNPQTIQVFELLTGKEIHRFQREDPVFAVAFSPDGRRLATGGEDTTALLWDLHNLDGIKHADTLSEETLAAYWKALADPDPAKAYAARVAMIHAPGSAIEFLAKKLQPVPRTDMTKVNLWIKELDDKSFAKRETAQKQLVAIDELAESAVRAAIAKPASEESKRRAEAVLAQISPLPRFDAEQLRTWRCIDILEYADSPKAREILKRLATGNPDHFLTKESARTLKRCEKRGVQK